MSNDDSDEWQFNAENMELNNDNTTETSITEPNTQSNDSSLFDNIDTSNIILLPLLVTAVYAFVEKAATLTAVETLIGTGTLAAVVTESLFIAGAIVVAGFAVLALLGAAAILGGLVRRSGALLAIGTIIGLTYGVLWAGANFLFGQFPLLVGATLTLNILFYGAALVAIFLAGISVIATLEV